MYLNLGYAVRCNGLRDRHKVIDLCLTDLNCLMQCPICKEEFTIDRRMVVAACRKEHDEVTQKAVPQR